MFLKSNIMSLIDELYALPPSPIPFQPADYSVRMQRLVPKPTNMRL